MKLIRSKKDDDSKNRTQELYPKVKTFSGAYGYTPAKNSSSGIRTGIVPTSVPDERPYPASVSSDIPGTRFEYEDPERIDLQDTLLTDESFQKRVPVRRPDKADEQISESSVPDAGSEESANSGVEVSEEWETPDHTAGDASVSDDPGHGEIRETAEPEEYVNPEDPEEPEGPEEPEESEDSEMPDYSAESDSDEYDFYEETDESTPAGEAGSGIDSFYESPDHESDPETGLDPFCFPESDDESDDEPNPESGVSDEAFPFPEFDADADDESDIFFDPDSDGETEEDQAYDAANEMIAEPGPDNAPETDIGSEPFQEPAPDAVSETVVRLLPKLEAKGKTSLTATWTPVAEADGYDLFFAQGGEPFSSVFRTLSPEETAFTFKQLGKKTVYKMRVSAFVRNSGRKETICESDTVRCITGGSSKKYTNASKIRIKGAVLDLSVGEKKRITASVTGLDPDKQVLSQDGLLHYLSENPSVAEVSKDGKVKGIAQGKCRIILIASNGIHSALDVSVHESPESIAFRKKKYSLKVGKQINLKKKLNSKPDGKSKALKWKSSDKEIAEVSRKGIVTALKKGRITVRVKTRSGDRAKVRIRINAAKKAETYPWESIGKRIKTGADHKWSYLA